MDLGITNIREGVEFGALIIGSLSIVIGVWTYILSTKQFRFEVMISCIQRFQDIFPNLQSADSEKKNRALQQYIDLCNEELFYFKQKYVPDEVVKEWLDGMISFLPLYNPNGEPVTKGLYPEIEARNLLEHYPRIRKAFQIPKSYDLKRPSDRMEIIKAIRGNLKHLNYPCA